MEDMSCAAETSTSLTSKVTPPPTIVNPSCYPDSPQFVGDELQYAFMQQQQQQQKMTRTSSPDSTAYYCEDDVMMHDSSEYCYYGDDYNNNNNNNNNNQYYYTQPTRKRVTFAEDAYLYSGDVTLEEVQQMWCTAQDFRNFKDERKDALRRMKQIGLDIDRLEREGYSMRGLEPYFSLETNRAIKAARKKSTDCVFLEQHRQRSRGIYDDEHMRAISMRRTKWARDVARKLAANDEAEIRKLITLDQLQREQQVRQERLAMHHTVTASHHQDEHRYHMEQHQHQHEYYQHHEQQYSHYEQNYYHQQNGDQRLIQQQQHNNTCDAMDCNDGNVAGLNNQLEHTLRLAS